MTNQLTKRELTLNIIHIHKKDENTKNMTLVFFGNIKHYSPEKLAGKYLVKSGKYSDQTAKNISPNKNQPIMVDFL